MINLTKMEIKILNAMRNNEYNDALESYPCGTWTFTAIENSKIEPKRARGVISSLVKKNLVECTNDEEDLISFTKEGLKLFENSNGEECDWGGPKLLKEK